MKRSLLSSLVFGLALTAPAFGAAVKLEPEQLEFFEKKIRPVLVDRCYKCHSAAEKIKGDLALDTRAGLLKGGQSGPAVVPKQPAKSLLIKVIKHEQPDMEMPPKEPKLDDKIIADFEQWIRMGAPDPREATDRKVAAVDLEAAKQHWAFKPVTKPAPPKVSDKKFVQSPIDAFVLAKLREKGLQPSAMADKQTLIRRVTYDLTGLPPTAEEVEAFVADKSKDAYQKLVDRLMASPHFGEHWGRMWLDIARYADTTGDRLNGGRRNPLYPFAWTYRDYVIEAFNKDVPYDQFVMQQIAGDQLPEAASDKSILRALGFITVGKTFMGNDNDMIDDRIDVISKGLMAFTVSCARCHDHKFDPITMKDYYGLHGVFNSTRMPTELPMIEEPAKTPEYADFLKQVKKIEDEVEEYHQKVSLTILAGMLDRTGDYLSTVREAKASGKASSGNFRLIAKKNGLDAAIFEHWSNVVRDAGRKHNPVVAPWLAYAELPDSGFAAKAAAVTAALGKDPAKPMNVALVKALQAKNPKSIKDVAAVYNQVFGDLAKEIGAKPFDVLRGARNPSPSPKLTKPLANNPDLDSLRAAFFGKDAVITVSANDASRLIGVQFRNGENAVRAKIYALEMTHPGSPARAMILEDLPKPRDSKIMIRGEPRNLGPVAPRQFIQVLAKPDAKPFQQGSGRLELARAIASKDNPLTPRVWVNRVWKNLFGEAIVRTPSDFGMRADKPTHPEMLDWLASYLMENNWSTKQLIRAIVLSSTYQQDSKSNAKAMQIDPTNELIWRMNIRRLPFESIRDTLLVVGGNLDMTMGGPPITVDASEQSARGTRALYGNMNLKLSDAPRRTVYGMIDRGALPEMFRTFDFANPDLSTGERILTTVPQQALFMMNSPFVADQVRHLLARPDFQAQKSPEDKVKLLYRLSFQRLPTDKELKMSLDFLSNQLMADKPFTPEPGAKVDMSKLKEMSKEERRAALAKLQTVNKNAPKSLDAWERYAQVLLLSNELIFVN
jgi:mono/diheme cytochrome c family protein